MNDLIYRENINFVLFKIFYRKFFGKNWKKIGKKLE